LKAGVAKNLIQIVKPTQHLIITCFLVKDHIYLSSLLQKRVYTTYSGAC